MNLSVNIHLKHPDFEVSIDPNKINYVQRIGNVVWVHFTGTPEPLQLRHELAEKFWLVVMDNSICICDDSAAVENKNAETHTS